MADRDIIIHLQKYLDYLIRNGYDIEKAFLYGSYSRGESTAESDIDVMLVGKAFDQRNDQQLGKLWRLTSEYNSRIEPYPIGSERFEHDHGSPLIQRVRQSGIEIRSRAV
ncbi:MAG: nucleotidyltransferase domain-containing protein [candidate division KSB1 bacterium]|nr:nucleotidyltransferase domain-containing protein [candidate division KSB1 bacterium]